MKKKKVVSKGKPERMKATSVRIEPAKLAEAAKLGIDLSGLFRDRLDQELLARNGKCPTCGKRDHESEARAMQPRRPKWESVQ